MDWHHRVRDSLYFCPSTSDPLAQRAVAKVEMKIPKEYDKVPSWRAFIPGVMDEEVGSREEAMALVEATIELRGGP